MIRKKNTGILWWVGILLIFCAKAIAQPRAAKSKVPDSISVYNVKAIANEHPDSAIQIMKDIISENKDNYSILFEGYFCMAATYFHINDYNKALEAYHTALLCSPKSEAPLTNLCRVINSTGEVFVQQGDYQKASQYYFRAASLAESAAAKDTNTADQLVRIYSNLSFTLIQLHEYDKALYYLDKAEVMANQLQHAWRLPNIWLYKAMIFTAIGQTDKAWEYGQKTLALSKKLFYPHAEFATLQMLATILLDKNKPNEAIPYLEANLRLTYKLNAGNFAKTYYLLGLAYLSTANYRLAQRYFDSALKKANESNAQDIKLKVHEQLSSLYTQTHNYHKALEHLQIAYRLNDTLLNKEKIEAVQLMEVKYRTAEKDNVIAQKELQLNKQLRRLQQKNIWIGSIAAGALILAILLFAIQRHYKQRNRLNVKQQEIDNLKATMYGEEKERARIARELHDGITGMVTAVKLNFTAVQNENPLIGHTENFTNAMHMLEETVHEIRYTSHNLTPEIIVHHELQDAISLFCQKAQKSSRLNISFMAYGVFEDLDNDFKLSIYRMTQELINNIVKHAQATQALVQLSRHGNTFGLTVEDDGIGWDTAGKQYGVGMQNIQSRVKSLEGKLTIDAAGGNGTTVYIEFNLPNSKNQGI